MVLREQRERLVHVLTSWFVYIGAGISVIGLLPYIRDTYRGDTSPHRVTWFLWGFIPLVTFVVQLHLHVGLVSLTTLVFGLMPLGVLIASVKSHAGAWAITRFDWFCCAISLAGTAVYVVTQRGVLSIVLLLIADFFAGIPTVRKSWTDPTSETWSAFAFSVASTAITLSTVTEWSFAAIAFPLYIVILNTAQVILITTQIGPKVYAARHHASAKSS
jgi:hypothetical protein